MNKLRNDKNRLQSEDDQLSIGKLAPVQKKVAQEEQKKEDPMNLLGGPAQEDEEVKVSMTDQICTQFYLKLQEEKIYWIWEHIDEKTRDRLRKSVTPEFRETIN